MSDWELVDISAHEPESSSEEYAESDQGGLSTGVETLHSNFWQAASHLSEAENRHMQVLVSAGMIPEDHIASVEPTRKLHWLVEELNGRIDPDGLSIPLKGLEIDDIEIYQKTENDETVYYVSSLNEKKYVPSFLIEKDKEVNDIKILLKGLKLVNDYLDKTILKPNNINFPNNRLLFLNTLR